MERWSQKTKWSAALAALLSGILGLYIVTKTPLELSAWLHWALPLVMAVVNFMLVGTIVHQIHRVAILKTLPEVNFPFEAVWAQLLLDLFLLLGLHLTAISLILWPESALASFVTSSVFILFMAVVLLLLLIGGNSLIVNEREEGRVYRDAVSSSLLSRQDYAYSFMGSYRDGLIICWKIWPYDQMRSYEIEGKRLIIRGQEQQENKKTGEKEDKTSSYGLILYTPRIKKFVKPFLERKRIPYR